jgi:hypothetical protein
MSSSLLLSWSVRPQHRGGVVSSDGWRGVIHREAVRTAASATMPRDSLNPSLHQRATRAQYRREALRECCVAGTGDFVCNTLGFVM